MSADSQTIDLARELQGMQSKLDHHDKVLDKLGDVHLQQVQQASQLLGLIEKQNGFQERTARRMDKQDELIDRNRTYILKFSGAMGFAVFAVGIVVALVK